MFLKCLPCQTLGPTPRPVNLFMTECGNAVTRLTLYLLCCKALLEASLKAINPLKCQVSGRACILFTVFEFILGVSEPGGVIFHLLKAQHNMHNSRKGLATLATCSFPMALPKTDLSSFGRLPSGVTAANHAPLFDPVL